MTVRLGYACINMTLQKRKPGKVFCSRGMIKRTFLQKGMAYASQLALLNSLDLIKIIAWNNEQGIKVFRMTSCLFPWMSEYELEDLPDFESIKSNLEYALLTNLFDKFIFDGSSPISDCVMIGWIIITFELSFLCNVFLQEKNWIQHKKNTSKDLSIFNVNW